MSYRVRIARQAETYLRRLDEPTQRRVLERLDQIAADPYGQHAKALTGPAKLRSARVGDYRIVFAVDDTDQVVEVRLIGPRGQIYRGI